MWMFFKKHTGVHLYVNSDQISHFEVVDASTVTIFFPGNLENVACSEAELRQKLAGTPFDALRDGPPEKEDDAFLQAQREAQERVVEAEVERRLLAAALRD